jgi:hypothetical protein
MTAREPVGVKLRRFTGSPVSVSRCALTAPCGSDHLSGPPEPARQALRAPATARAAQVASSPTAAP